jgi:hypothetical protein
MGSRPSANPIRTPPTRPEAISVSPNGVDLTLIRWMLSLTPVERLRTLQGAADSLGRLRRGANGS